MNGQALINSKPSVAVKRSSPPVGGSKSDSLRMDDNRIPSNGSSSNGNGPSMQLTSDEVNFLVFRYLQEAGKRSIYIVCKLQ